MKEITILSGKGGAGKTSITAALASVAQNAVFCDNDVDAADLHLIFHPDIKEKYSFRSGNIAEIDSEKCINCELCKSLCRFDSIHYNTKNQLEINPFQCEGCRLCERICPENAISMIEKNNNLWFVSTSRFGPLVHARMGPGEENSGKLVTEVRKKAKEIALNSNIDYIINDGPPGIGCSAISSVTGSDLVLLIIEPTLSGLHDSKRLVELVESFNIPILAVINKFNLNQNMVQNVEVFLNEKGIKLIGKINFHPGMVESMVLGKTIIEYLPESEISFVIRSIWETISKN